MSKISLTYCLFLLFLSSFVCAQEVGLVLSGGGAKGLAHIGVLKALEEHEIPIDYITGTSMGGIVGGMYAAGYSPEEIEEIVLTKDFQNWSSGKYGKDFNYYFYKEDDNAGWVPLRIGFDSTFNISVNAKLVDDIPINMALAEYFTEAASSSTDFDSLFVPFRCTGADVFTQKSLALDKGLLADAVRVTMSVPLFFQPIKYRGKYLFDGGLYDNFPAEIMKETFDPDVLIGVNVSRSLLAEYPYGDDEEVRNNSLLYLLFDNADPCEIPDSNGVYLEPILDDHSAFSFEDATAIIEAGYYMTSVRIDEIKEKVARRRQKSETDRLRSVFRNQQEKLTGISKVTVKGLHPKQAKHVKDLLGFKKRAPTMLQFKKGYYRLASEGLFTSMQPRIFYNPETVRYEAEMNMREDKMLKVNIGGNLASRSISNIYLGLRYNYFRWVAYNFSADLYTGRFYQSAKLKAKITLPSRFPIYFEPEFIYNHWDYIRKNDLFGKKDPVILEQTDRRIGVNMGFPIGYKGKMVLSGAYVNNDDQYSNNNTLVSSDTLDITQYKAQVYSLSYQRNSLNKKQYANEGSSLLVKVGFFLGKERHVPGNTSVFKQGPDNILGALRINFSHEKYFSWDKFSLGYLTEVVVSGGPAFNNFRAALIASPAFYPLQDSRTLFLENFRANIYAAGGLRAIYKFTKNLDLRAEGYMFQPIFKAVEDKIFPQYYDDVFVNERPYFAASANLVYHSPVGPVSAAFNYYDDPKQQYGFLFHFGYLIFNKRSLD